VLARRVGLERRALGAPPRLAGGELGLGVVRAGAQLARLLLEHVVLANTRSSGRGDRTR
jgi:hypothetical protein